MAKLLGFKPCRVCHRQMSISDPHRLCLWLESDARAYSDCKSMHPKVIRKQAMMLLEAWQKRAPRHSRGRSRGRLQSRVAEPLPWALIIQIEVVVVQIR